MNKAEIQNLVKELSAYDSNYDNYIMTEQDISILADELLAKINYTRCSLELPTDEREKLIDDSYFLNLQNLSGREDFEEAFKLGIMTGVDETIEHLKEKQEIT